MFKSFFDTLNSGYELPKNTNIVGSDIFSMDSVNDFRIQTNLDTRTLRDIQSQLNGFSDPITLDSLNVTPSTVDIIFSNNTEIFLNFDRSKVTNYSYFGSLKEFIRVSIEQILLNFPASLYISNENNSSIMLTLLNYSYDKIRDVSSMKIPVGAIINKYNLNYTEKSYLLNQTDNIRDITSNYTKYTIWNFTDEYPIVSFSGSTDLNTGYLNIEVQGNPFPDSDGLSSLIKFHIKPNYLIYENFINGLEDFEAYLLNRDTTPKYTALFKEPVETSDGQIILVDKFYTWQTSDGYNLDYDGYGYQVYLESLLDLGNKYDDYKTNLISRFLTTSALKEFDTPDNKMQKLLNIYGREFDEIKKYIDGLANIAKVSYNKKDNIPDTLVKNFAKTLGFGTFNTVSSNDLMQSFLGANQDPIFSGQSRNLTPVETDIELWRRLIINSAYLFKSKGTRSCINFLFKIIGAPESLVDFNEYVYLVDKKIDISAITNNSDLNYPFDTDGNPIVSGGTPDYYFQMKGGWRANIELAPNNSKDLISIIGVHSGDYDNGQSYFDVFRNFGNQKGFELYKTVDNVKSWIYSSEGYNRVNLDTNTNYSIQDSKLTLNTKEVSIFLDPAQAIETDVYNYNVKTDYVINDTQIPYPFPDTILTRAEVSNLSFIEYIDLIYTKYINAKNRKVISDNQGGGYSTLKNLYDSYFNGYTNDSVFTDEFTEEFTGDINNVPSNQLNFYKVNEYLKLIEGYWLSLIEQFIPSTTIWEGGKKYRNTIFDRQKFVYRHGIDDGSEFAKKQDEKVNKEIIITKISGKVSAPYKGNTGSKFMLSGNFTSNLSFSGDTNSNVNRLTFRSRFSTNFVKISEPSFSMGQVAKIQTGFTEPVIHNITSSRKQIDFIFTGNTNYLNLNNDPFAVFKYNIYQYNNVNSGFTNTSVYGRELLELSGITGSTRVVNEIVPFGFNDGDYLVKGTFKLSGSTSGDTINPTGFTFNNENKFNSSLYYQYGLYDKNRDYWFTILSDPMKPIIDTSSFDSGATQSNHVDAIIVNDVISITETGQTVFIYNFKPNGEIFLNVNGNTLLKSSGITFSDDGDYFVDYFSLLNAIIITLKNPLYNDRNDVLNIIYIKDSSGEPLLKTESQTVTTIPSGTGATIGSQIYFNTDTNVFEYYFNFHLNIDVDYDQLIVMLNGTKLIKNVDYIKSSTNDVKIIFNGDIEIGDILVFYYPTINLPNTLILDQSQFIAVWSSTNNNQNGFFTAQITTGDDTNFDNIILSATTNYSTGNTYTLSVGQITTPNSVFLYRIKSEKFFTNFLGETFTTIAYSNIITFNTDNRILGT